MKCLNTSVKTLIGKCIAFDPFPAVAFHQKAAVGIAPGKTDCRKFLLIRFVLKENFQLLSDPPPGILAFHFQKLLSSRELNRSQEQEQQKEYYGAIKSAR